MKSLSVNYRLKLMIFLLLWFLFQYQVLSYEVIEKCEDGCHNQVNLEENVFDMACNDSCKLQQCQIGCQRWTEAEPTCYQACNDSTNVNSWVLYCVLGCNHALSVYIEKIKLEVGIPSAPTLVADTLTNESLKIEWNSAPYLNITYLVQWRYELLGGDWNYYNTDSPLNTSRVEIKGLDAYTQYRFRVEWIALRQYGMTLFSHQSVIISTLPYGVPSSSPKITSLIAISAAQISVSWEPPKFPNGPILSYALYLNEYPNGPIIVKDILNSHTTDTELNLRHNKSSSVTLHYMFNSLKADTSYKISVVTRNNFGEGPKAERNVTTLESDIKQDLESEITFPELILATDREIIRRDPLFPIDGDVLYRLSDYTLTTTHQISGLAVHVEYKYIFVSDTNGSIRRISLKDENNRQIKRVVNDINGKPSHLSVDWLNDKLYMIKETEISRCNLDGEYMESVITGFKNRPSDMKVDPYNGFLYWLSNDSNSASLYRVDLSHNKSDILTHNYANLIYQDSLFTTFTVDFLNYRIYLPVSRETSIFSITIDGSDPTNIRHNAQRSDQLESIENLVVHDKLFYFTKGTEVFREEYEKENDKYHHSSTQIEANSLVSLCVMDYKSQPYPVPLNPVRNVEAVFLDRSAKIVWQKPELLGGTGLGAWQEWSYEVSIEETSSPFTFLDRGLTFTHCEADELNPDTEYFIKVRAFSKAGNGSWSQGFHGKTLRRIGSDSRFPFALWSTKERVIKSNIVGDRVENLVHKMSMNGTTVNDIAWYRDLIFLNGENNIYIYNITSHSSLKKLSNITNSLSIAIDWIAPKIYWSCPSQQMISRSNLDGSQSEPLPIATFAKEIAIDSVNGYIYWATGQSIEFSRLNGMNPMKYLEFGLFANKHVMGLSLNLERSLIYWIVRSHDKAMLYSAQLANTDNLHQISKTIKPIGQVSESAIRGPLVYYSDRMFWIQEEHNEALISDAKGQNLAVLRGQGIFDINTLAIVDPSLQPIPNGFETLTDIVVIPHDVKAENIKVIGSWDNFTIVWESVQNVNYDVVFYDLLLEDRHHYTHTMITGETKYSYPSSSQLPPYSKIKLAIRAFTYWASSKQTITEIYSPMYIPTKPTMPRIFVNYERSTYDNSIEKILAEFRWSPPDLPNGIILGYAVNAWSIQSGQKNIEVENARVESNQINLSELKINTTYYFQVQAFTEAGDGPPSDIIGAHSSEEHPVPQLLVAKSDSIRMVDIDSHKEKLLTSKAIIPLSVTYIRKENTMFWIEEDGILKRSHFNGSNTTVIHQMSSPGTDITVDWIGRHLYWSERDLNAQKSTIWSYNLNDPKAKPIQVNSKNNVFIGSIEIDPFSSVIIWTEMFRENQGILKVCSITTATNFPPNVTLFFKQNNSRNKRALNELCNCAAHPVVSNAITIDRSNYGKSELLWYDSKYNRIMASDMSGCHCRIVINSTYSFPPTSLTVDNDFIYWSNSTLGNVYKIRKNSNARKVSLYKAVPQVMQSSEILDEPHLVLSETVNGVHGIRAFSDHLQPYPNFECLVPMEYHETVKLIDNTANSLTVAMHEVRRPLGCSKTTLASVLYTIYYGKVLSDGYFECGLSLRGCKTLETYNDTITISGLDPYTNYTIRVAVKNFYTPNDSINLPGPPINLETAEAKPSPPRNVIAKVETPHQIVVIWEPPEKPNGDPILYEIRWYSSKNQDWHKAMYSKKPNTTHFGDKFVMRMSDNIEPASTYFITVRAYSSDSNYHSDSHMVSATTYHLPNQIILEENTSRSIKVTWISPVSDSNESEIGHHTMQYSIAANQQWIGQQRNHTKPSTKYEFRFNNLMPNTEYSFRLLLTYRSTTSLFYWPEKDKYIFKTLGDAPEIPETPEIVDIGIGQHVYKVWWTPVSGNGAQNIFYNLIYKLLHKSDEDMYLNEWISVYNGSDSYWLIEGLSMDKEYVFKVEAMSEFGSSNFSEESDSFYYPNREILINSSDADLITISSGIFGAILFVFIVLILFCTIRRRQVQEQKKKALEDDRMHRNAADLELVPWPELPGHPHHTNALYTNSNFDLDELVGIPKITREQISITQFLGSGAFGEVFEGYWHQSDSSGPKITKVAIKTLGKGATDEERIDFLKEAKLMANFRHPHILQLQGICLEINLNFLILELMEGGDLLKYLRNSRPRGAIPSPLIMDDLISICTDVAKGCKYLEDIHFVHRDLAARNCLVSSFDRNTRVVKIGDFGLARDIYKNDYYRKEGEGLLPVRWMAPESLVDGVFTSQSDVWAFGVLLYEVMSLGQQPYQARSNPQVLNYVRSGGILDRPLNCPDDMFCLMMRCWTYQRENRPTFSDCLEALTEIRKNTSCFPSAITSVHNQNYIFNRGFDNPGYSEDERQAGNSCHKLKSHSSCSSSAQTCSSNLTNDTTVATYQNGHIKYLELIGNHEECGLTDADGYQIPISKSPLQISDDKNKLLNTMNQIVLNSNDSRRVPPTASIRRKQLTDSSRSCSPPPTYSQVFKVTEIALNSDSLLKYNLNERQLDENMSQNRLCSSNETKNCLLVRNDKKESNIISTLSQSPLSSSPTSYTSSSSSPTVAAALLKTQSPLSISHPSRTMTETKYCFNEEGVPQKIIDSLLSDGRQSNNCSTEDEEDYEDFDTETIAANDLFCNTTCGGQHSLTVMNTGFTNPVVAQINDQSKYAIITRLERKSPLQANNSYSYDNNSSWC